jgi:hypothetical protein
MTRIDAQLIELAEQSVEVIRPALEDGFLTAIAEAKVEGGLPSGHTAEEVAEIVRPEPVAEPGSGPVLEPRWSLLPDEEAGPAVKETIAGLGTAILQAATALDMRRLGESGRLPEALDAIDDRARFLVESGANRTSIVRRGLAVIAMQLIHGDAVSERAVLQFGGNRNIQPTRADGSANPEHRIIRELTGDRFDEDQAFTEFEANVATAVADGYNQVNAYQSPSSAVSKGVVLTRAEGYPRLRVIQPTGPRFDEALDTLVVGDRQLVITTNGQYRPKARLQTGLWAARKGIDDVSVIALGDEGGDVFAYAGPSGDVDVADRPAGTYVNEFIVVWRLASRLLAARDAA